ncbi:MAG: ATP12 family chaperone protein, partial [Rhodospirillales bacterium]
MAKRFYADATVAAAAAGHGIALDGRLVTTPAGRPLTLPSAALAAAVAGEWRAQGDQIRPQTMPLTRLAATAVDRVAPARAAVVDGLVAYAGADLLCYRAVEPADLVALQQAAWQPLLDWAAGALAARLTVTAGVIPVDQPAGAVAALRAAVERLDDPALTALAAIVPVCGSLVVGLALAAGRIDAETAFEVSQLDERYQSGRWGEDREAMERRRRLRDDLRSAAL